MTSRALTLKYRPVRFTDVVEQGPAKVILTKIVNSDEVPNAIILAGSRGTGKTTTARIFAAALNCPHEDKPCGDCASCKAVQSSNGLDVLEIDAASNGSVTEIRKIKEQMSFSHEARWRVVILDEAHSMSREANNALLKLLEEPPPNTVFILATTEPNKILETVRSRCMTLEYRRMSIAGIIKRLSFIRDAEGMEATDDLLAVIAERVQGGMRDAIMTLDQINLAGITTVEKFNEMQGIRNISVPLLTAAVDSNMTRGYQLLEEHFFRSGDAGGLVNDLVSLVRDLIVLKNAGTIVATAHDIEERTALAGRIQQPKLVAIMKVLWDLKARTRHVDNDQRAAMEMAFVLISDALVGSASATRGTPTQPNKKLTIHEMVALGATIRTGDSDARRATG